ncbi:MAG: DinB family protein [Pyrinomonadaceae bacterium]|nr:DinB family protein [Pyrinomonadaceae bacterium]
MKTETITLQPVPNFSPEIGLFLASLYKIREAWKVAVKDLSKTELAAKILPDVQPIGTIIIHIAEVEYFWIQQIVEGKELTAEIVNLLHHDLWFRDFAAEDLDIDYCLEVVEKIHQMTLETLAKFTDADLKRTFVRMLQDRETHYSLRWIFVHLLEHDAEHKGQILMIKRLLRKN